jgi:hypothetical protein
MGKYVLHEKIQKNQKTQQDVEDLNGRKLSNRALNGALKAVDGILFSYHLFCIFYCAVADPVSAVRLLL